jgi:3-oxoacyl-[acyl-carrier-protein] synthase-3
MIAGETPVVWHDGRSLKVLGTATALPGEPVSTDELLDRVDRRYGLTLGRRGRELADRLGIRTRHICRAFESRREAPRPGQSNPDLAAAALTGGLAAAGLTPGDLDYVIGHTATPARPVPSNIALVADRLGYRGPYMELRQACTGFANALVIAQGLLAAPGARHVALVGSETGSVFFDPQRAVEDTGQLVNLVQMGDGAAAIILGRDDGMPGARLSHVFSGQIGLGRAPGFTMMGGGSDHADWPGVLEFEHQFAAVRDGGPALFAAGMEAARDVGWPLTLVDRIIPHQANGHLASLLAERLGVSAGKVVVNADRVGNTGSAAIWLALAQLREGFAPGIEPGASVLALGAEATKYMFGGFIYRHG